VTLIIDIQIESIELISGIVLCKLPGNGCLLAVPFSGPGIHFFRESRQIAKTPVKALLGKGGKFDLRHIQPAGSLGRVKHLEALG
jgi:hypothetical protein